jgi:Family of unknown function (DUF6328)
MQPSPASDSKLLQKDQIAVQESRMVLPGVQALFGFQMIAIFDTRFETLSALNQLLHLLALVLTTLSIALIMAPAAYHRIVEPEAGSKFFVRLASALIVTAMVPLAISLTLDIYIVATLIVRSALFCATIAIAVFIAFAGLWFAYPLAKRRRVLVSLWR